VADYAETWLPKGEALGIADALNDRARLRDHVLGHIGQMPLERVQPRHLAELFTNLRKSKVVAPKTIHNIYSPVRALFRDAKLEGLYPGDSPCILTRFQLGENVDKDPEWRANAVFSHSERVSLITDERIPLDRRTYSWPVRCREILNMQVLPASSEKSPEPDGMGEIPLQSGSANPRAPSAELHPSYSLANSSAVTSAGAVEAPGTAPGSGGAPLMSLRACPAI
jgi:hypothetical protein